MLFQYLIEAFSDNNQNVRNFILKQPLTNLAMKIL